MRETKTNETSKIEAKTKRTLIYRKAVMTKRGGIHMYKHQSIEIKHHVDIRNAVDCLSWAKYRNDAKIAASQAAIL
jgi:hypothetical protein